MQDYILNLMLQMNIISFIYKILNIYVDIYIDFIIYNMNLNNKLK